MSRYLRQTIAMMNKQIDIQAVVFDFFGVLIGGENNQHDRWRYVARQLGMESKALMDFLAQGESYRQVQAGRMSEQAWWAERMGVLKVDLSQQQSLFDQLFNRWSANPYCVDLIEQLRAKGVRLALLSNATGPSARLKKEYPFLAYFDAIMLSGEMGVAKPSKAAFRAVERALDLPPHALLFVDDTLGNVLAARRVGWQSHHFKHVESLRLELEAWLLL